MLIRTLFICSIYFRSLLLGRLSWCLFQSQFNTIYWNDYPCFQCSVIKLWLIIRLSMIRDSWRTPKSNKSSCNDAIPINQQLFQTFYEGRDYWWKIICFFQWIFRLRKLNCFNKNFLLLYQYYMVTMQSLN